jgi:DNA-binding LacI/PurR family transcriptional regulator
MPSSHDVAVLAGVSQSTVSAVMIGKPVVTQRTREKVLAAANQLNYRPNLAARAMRNRKTGRLALVFAITEHHPVHAVTGATEVAEAAGYALEVLSLIGDAAARSQRLVELATSGQYEGILTFVDLLPADEAYLPPGIPLISPVSFGGDLHGLGAMADPAPIAELIEHLAGLGHRRFLHVAGPADFVTAMARRDTYLQTIESLGLESLGVFGGDWSAEAGIEAVRALPDDAPPLAIIAANDRIAVGVMRACAERNWTIPGDVSVTGWDNYDVSPYLTPSLTTVDRDKTEAGRREMLRLLAALRGEEPPQVSASLNTIIWRESTAAPTPAT